MLLSLLLLLLMLLLFFFQCFPPSPSPLWSTEITPFAVLTVVSLLSTCSISMLFMFHMGTTQIHVPFTHFPKVSGKLLLLLLLLLFFFFPQPHVLHRFSFPFSHYLCLLVSEYLAFRFFYSLGSTKLFEKEGITGISSKGETGTNIALMLRRIDYLIHFIVIILLLLWLQI
ncbi:hypothetical protein, unlikely [Trypanosoma brucei gambiense DAL972]|uniref:T. brucei spp.-specific protein n=1 Tax=Trypanosoma brucei gambiense (strain MHOM/CI/86/DAL972) TaxID=679716 RepID=C9ZWW2_TRYB9|nr:hypothetical protein, unlikely [Trypanosoma brucei gambiense DAL972]CBH13901.1 hypothetical protein, unlikely [Trypanosoma brucei gambiense DAL972]|eukprot:XP_011776177.1 hypothetical protein, unlikely [Trypanosoma brucei gambiense DAL972]